MKKILCMIMMLALLMSALALTVSAEEAAPDYSEEFPAFAYYDYGDNINATLQTDSLGTTLAIALKPLDEISAEGCWFEYEVEIPGDCVKLEFVINYAAKGDNRYMDFIFNEETRHEHLENTNDWAAFYEHTITFESVKKGTYAFRLACPADFDNDTIKTPNVDNITVNMYFEDYENIVIETEAPETEAPETEAPETEAPVTEAPETEAPETTGASEEKGGCGSSVGMAAAIVTIVSVMGTAVIRRK